MLLVSIHLNRVVADREACGSGKATRVQLKKRKIKRLKRGNVCGVSVKKNTALRYFTNVTNQGRNDELSIGALLKQTNKIN